MLMPCPETTPGKDTELSFDIGKGVGGEVRGCFLCYAMFDVLIVYNFKQCPRKLIGSKAGRRWGRKQGVVRKG